MPAFLLKFIIVLSGVVITLMLAMEAVSIKISNMVESSKYLPGYVISKVDKMPPEEREALKLRIREKVKQVKPLVDEIMVLFKDGNETKKT